jgi:hypothetical protein
MNRTKDELLLECIKQFEHIEDVLGFNRLSTTKSLINEIEQALRIHDVVGRSEQLKCQCKKAKFTRTVDADFNPLCGRCGKAL